MKTTYLLKSFVAEAGLNITRVAKGNWMVRLMKDKKVETHGATRHQALKAMQTKLHTESVRV